jgi:hypothetical protein
MAEEGRQRLTSWKEIAAYLGRDVRTVLRWEKETRAAGPSAPWGDRDTCPFRNGSTVLEWSPEQGWREVPR